MLNADNLDVLKEVVEILNPGRPVFSVMPAKLVSIENRKKRYINRHFFIVPKITFIILNTLWVGQVAAD